MSKSSQTYTPPGTAYRWVMRLLAFVALAVSSLLVWVSFADGAQVPGCGGDALISGCDSALASVWGRWLTVPVSALAVGNYVFIMVALFLIGPGQPALRQRMAWAGLLVCTLAAGGAAIWFVAVMFVKLNSICTHCLGVHACGIVLAVMAWLSAPIRLDPPFQAVHLRPALTVVLVTVSILAVAALAAGQVLYRPLQGPTHLVEYVATSDSKPDPPISSDLPVSTPSDPGRVNPKREVLILGGQVRLRPYEGPIVGSPAAPHIILSFFDYTCSHCRKMHEHLGAIRRRYGDQLAILAQPIPLDRACNRGVRRTHKTHKNACALAILALRVWKTDSSKFELFDSWMFSSPKPPSVDAAREHAMELVGKVDFRKSKYHPWPRRRIDANIAIQSMLDRQSLPVLIIGDRIVWGPPKATEELFELFEEGLNIKPVTSGGEMGTP